MDIQYDCWSVIMASMVLLILENIAQNVTQIVLIPAFYSIECNV